jgi:serine/threonine protein kinase
VRSRDALTSAAIGPTVCPKGEGKGFPVSGRVSDQLTLIGQKLGHYRIVEEIGAGGMGVVYRAHDEHLDRDVAIKVLPSGMLGGEGARKRFRKEARSLSKLNHPKYRDRLRF